MNIMAMRWSKLSEGTKAEIAIEDEIAALGVPYRFQFPGYKYGCRFFPDYYLPTLKLVIEIDDKSHDKKTEADQDRSNIIFQTWGAQVVRCTNEEALNDPHGAVVRMLSSVGLWPLPAKLPRLKTALPPLRKAEKKVKREMNAAAMKAKRAAIAKSKER
jgi:very-short-patch-repair endonuclease